MIAWVRSDNWLLLSGTMRDFCSAVTVLSVLLAKVLASRSGGLTMYQVTSALGSNSYLADGIRDLRVECTTTAHSIQS
jgi:hypothetical protein